MKDGMKRGPAMKLEKQAKIFREKSRASEKAKSNIFGSFHVGYGLFSISYPGQLICLDLLKEMRHIRYFTIHYIFSVMIRWPRRRFLKLLEISYLRRRYVFLFAGPNTHFSDMIC